MFHRVHTLILVVVALWLGLSVSPGTSRASETDEVLSDRFAAPPVDARPWVYWFWMDGNISREGITADLESMQRVGIGGVILMEVDVGVPRGPVAFMSEAWRALFKHAVLEAERLGLQITLNAGPGWTGSGGPWVNPEQSMQHLVASALPVEGPAEFDAVLPQPRPRDPHFVHAPIPASLQQVRDEFYRDVAVLAFPTPAGEARLAASDEKALYYRNPYSSSPGVKPYLPALAAYPEVPANAAVDPARIVDLSPHLAADGRLRWTVPAGHWTLMRFGRTSTGANTRPAPVPGIGLESDKFSREALEAHFDAFVGALLREIGPRPPGRTNGWTMLHIDSWEMGAQNWTPRFREEFARRRGYDPLPYLPAFTGRFVGSVEVSERFLWDVRQTAQELVIENHARHLRTLGRQHGFGLSIEPYDMNPCSDLSLGGEADVPMCEFWAEGYGFNTVFSCLEAVSIAHTLGRPVVAAEAFTADAPEAWKLHPGAMKPQADWALCFGINRLVVHRFAHQPWLDRWPGMTMGPYGVHYERTQTWWELSGAWHTYLARCQWMLRRGLPVADICYVALEGAPQVFRPPPGALSGSVLSPDRRGYNFDACAPETVVNLMRVEDGRLRLPGGMSYRVLVLPEAEIMTPALLRKVRDLVIAGATVLGPRPLKSPSLSGYPECDAEIARLAEELWGPAVEPPTSVDRRVGQGRVITLARATPTVSTPPLALAADARWIWHDEGNPASAAPVAAREFRRSFVCPEGAAVRSARLAMTADNTFEAALNGQPVGRGDNFRELYSFDLKPLLRSGENLLTVRATNGGDRPNPAGLIGVIEVSFDDGRVWRIPTDASWLSAVTATAEMRTAKELGPAGMGPWGEIGNAAAASVPVPYPPYDKVVGVLTAAGVPPDFEAVESLRYTHRRELDGDIYFVANREAAPVRASATFRVQGRQPELWDPMTGSTRLLPVFWVENGRTVVPLEFQSHGSYFIVFREPVAARSEPPAEGNTAKISTVFEIAGPWEVEFQPGRGAPKRVTFVSLSDWTMHPDSGVRHFSGWASYRTSFQLDAAQVAALREHEGWVDLGEVHVMARVRLNGAERGVAWKAPHRLAVGTALRAGENLLEITVANLWPNRLIGDQGLPASERTTWTTWDPYKPDSLLLPSGLLGPVTLQGQVPPASPSP